MSSENVPQVTMGQEEKKMQNKVKPSQSLKQSCPAMGPGRTTNSQFVGILTWQEMLLQVIAFRDGLLHSITAAIAVSHSL
jgi:hypothetical protein